jgi:hypothetical protein
VRGSRSGEHGAWLELGSRLSTQVGFAGALRFRPLSEVCVCVLVRKSGVKIGVKAPT